MSNIRCAPARLLLGFGLAALFPLSACINTPEQSLEQTSPGFIPGGGLGDPEEEGGGGGSSTSGPKFKISTVTMVPTGSGDDQSEDISIFFDTGYSPSDTIPNSCTTSTCSCRLVWTQINETSGLSTSYQRTVFSPIKIASNNFFTKCTAPDAYSSEIPTGTPVKIKVVGNPGTGIELQMSSFTVIKGGTDASADFMDEEGRGFRNVHRYSCFERNRRGMTIFSKMDKVTDPVTSEEKDAPLATGHCIRKASGTQAGGDDGCQGSGADASLQTSAQSYYYNLFVRSDSVGTFNFSNERYYCPTVAEHLNVPVASGTVSAYTGGGAAWPLDSQFALALRPSPDWPVAVESPSVLGIAADPSTGTASCEATFPTEAPGDGDGGDGGGAGGAGGDGGGGAAPTGPAGNEISVKCLGFARKPNADGSCPYFRDRNGNIRLTFRLRRFVALYPPTFDTNGEVLGQAIPADVVLVVDRPVRSPNPLEPYAMLGPKPCPFAYFDHSGVTARYSSNAIGVNPYNLNFPVRRLNDMAGAWNIPGWVSTNDPLWDNKSVDGVIFPNKDWDGTQVAAINDPLEPDAAKRSNQINVGPSCGTAFPRVMYDPDGSVSLLKLSTSHTSADSSIRVNLGGGISVNLQAVHVRPTNSWHPTYREDTEFQACVPLSTPFKDPPLHFAKDPAGNISWCAASYPTQLDSLERIDKRKGAGPEDIPLGYVRTYTSPHIKNINAAFTPQPSVGTGAFGPATLVNSPAVSCVGSGLTSTGSNDFAAHANGETENEVNEYDPGFPTASDTTCDRTVIVTEDLPTPMPLQAHPRFIENALFADSSYNCAVTFDKNGVKSTNKESPSHGCCGRDAVNNELFTVPLRTGAPLPAATTPDRAQTAHLEPAVYTTTHSSQTQPPFCNPPNY
ncbi:MAG: hypothetical protein IT285_15800 [Bdellovibrionales bacterium]|nr:hypothetical protein [Bdellovibrionales bacterium]